MVQVYLMHTNDLPDPREDSRVMEHLSLERQRKILRYRYADDRKESLGAGLLLQNVLRRYEISDDQIRLGEHGKPEVDGIYFSLSHSYHMAVCAVSSRPVGCDVQKILLEPDKVAERFFHEQEVRYLEQFEKENRDEAFCRLWTMKESYVKMTGEGMTLPFQEFLVEVQEQAAIYRDGKQCPCLIKEYELPGYKLTVCAEEEAVTDRYEWVSQQFV